MRIVVTGAAGFIGLHLTKALQEKGFHVIACVRNASDKFILPAGVKARALGTLDANTDWDSVLEKGDIVIHLAGRAHVLKDGAVDPIAEFRKVNRDATRTLALACATKGVSRLVFVSSIGVNGASTSGRPFSEADVPAPAEPYAVSKWEAEKDLAVIGREQGLDFTIIRPPLVYGPGNPGNFLRLLRLAASGLPLPLLAFENRRSMVFVGNLIDAVLACLIAPAAAGKTYVVSDGQDVSTPELIARMRQALEQPPGLFNFPARIVSTIAGCTGFGRVFKKLTCSLLVDSSKIRMELAWNPPVTFLSGLTETVVWYKNNVAINDNRFFKRIIDVLLALPTIFVLGLPMLLLSVLVKITSPGPVLYWSDRVGRNNKIFKMPKFRTMRTETPAVATHLLANADKFITPVGKFLRKSSLDELPQLLSILAGDMSFVGPRPALFNQDDLIGLRTAKGVQRITPGLTGWAQVNGRDDLPIPVKVDFDEYYLKHRSMLLDIKILFMTFFQVFAGKGVKH